MISENTKLIIKRIREEADRSIKATSGAAIPLYKDNPIPIKDYVTACFELLEIKDIFPDSLLQDRIKYFSQDGKLKLHLPENYRCCLAIIPCTIYGFPLEKKEIADGNYLRALVVDEAGKTAGFTSGESYLFNILPMEIQQNCTFNIGKYEPEDLYSISEADRNKIINLYKKVFFKIKKLFQ